MSRNIACGSRLHPRMNTKPKPFTQEVTDLLEGRWRRDSGVTGKTKAARSAQFQYLNHSPHVCGLMSGERGPEGNAWGLLVSTLP